MICSHLLFWEEESDQSDQCQEKGGLRSLTNLPYISDDQPLGLSLDTENLKIKPLYGDLPLWFHGQFERVLS